MILNNSFSPLVAAPKQIRIKMDKYKIRVLFCTHLDATAEEIRRYLAGAFLCFFLGQARKNRNSLFSVVST